jgi:transposase-like protein
MEVATRRVHILDVAAHPAAVICTTNAIMSINARLRRAVNARGHLPTEQAALKCLYLAIMSLDPIGKGRQRVGLGWVEGEPFTAKAVRDQGQPGSLDAVGGPGEGVD